MTISHATLDTCAAATNTVVVIDVLRAFTTAVYAFQAGASQILPVGTVAEAMALKQQHPAALIMGEVGGYPPPEFDLGNSPAALIGQDLMGKTLIQRTSAGTQGLVLSTQATTLFAASFACASATVRAVQRQSAASVTLVSTTDHGEDRACADYLAACLQGDSPDPTPFLERVRAAGEARIARAQQRHTAPELVAAFRADLDCAMRLDYGRFALRVVAENGRLHMHPQPQG